MTMHKETPMKHVLVIDDEPDFSTLLAWTLENDGFDVATANSTEQALLMVELHKPDLITLDIQMPRRSGLLFYRLLMSDPSRHVIPVVVVTGLTRDDRELEGLIHDFLEVDHVPKPFAYLEKPVDGGELLRVAREAVGDVHPEATSV